MFRDGDQSSLSDTTSALSKIKALASKISKNNSLIKNYEARIEESRQENIKDKESLRNNLIHATQKSLNESDDEDELRVINLPPAKITLPIQNSEAPNPYPTSTPLRSPANIFAQLRRLTPSPSALPASSPKSNSNIEILSANSNELLRQRLEQNQIVAQQIRMSPPPYVSLSSTPSLLTRPSLPSKPQDPTGPSLYQFPASSTSFPFLNNHLTSVRSTTNGEAKSTSLSLTNIRYDSIITKNS